MHFKLTNAKMPRHPCDESNRRVGKRGLICTAACAAFAGVPDSASFISCSTTLIRSPRVSYLLGSFFSKVLIWPSSPSLGRGHRRLSLLPVCNRVLCASFGYLPLYPQLLPVRGFLKRPTAGQCCLTLYLDAAIVLTMVAIAFGKVCETMTTYIQG